MLRFGNKLRPQVCLRSGKEDTTTLQRYGFVIYLITYGNESREGKEACCNPFTDHREVQADMGKIFGDSACVYVP